MTMLRRRLCLALLVLAAHHRPHPTGAVAPEGEAPASPGQVDDGEARDGSGGRRLEALPFRRPPASSEPFPDSTHPARRALPGEDGGASSSPARCDIQRNVAGCDDWDRVVVSGGIEVTQHPRVLYLRDFSSLRDLGVQVHQISDLQPTYLSSEDPSWRDSARAAFSSPDFFSAASAEFYVQTGARRSKQPPGGSRGWEVAKRPTGDAWGSAFLASQRNDNPNPVDPVSALMFPHPIPEPGIAVFRNAAVNRIGDLQTQTGTLVFLKGCFDWVTRWEELLWHGGIETDDLPVYDTIISIANRHTMGAFFHFLLDGVARLPMTEGLLREHPGARIHIVRPVSGSEPFMGEIGRGHINFRQQEGFFDNFQVPLMELLGFARGSVVTGNVFARTVYVPEPPACFCHSPALVHSFRAMLARRMHAVLPAAPASSCTVLVIDRSGHAKGSEHIKTRSNRVVTNHAEVIAALKAATAHALPGGCAVKEHHEGLTLHEQLTLFREALAVVGPHGAAFSLLLASQEGTVVVEFLNGTGEQNLAMLHLALLLKLKYAGRVIEQADHFKGGMIIPPQTVEETAELVARRLRGAKPRPPLPGAPGAASAPGALAPRPRQQAGEGGAGIRSAGEGGTGEGSKQASRVGPPIHPKSHIASPASNASSSGAWRRARVQWLVADFLGSAKSAGEVGAWDDMWNPLGNCSGALRDLALPMHRPPNFGGNFSAGFRSALQVAGLGVGSTGTRAVLTLLCQLGLRGLHYQLLCPHGIEEVPLQVVGAGLPPLVRKAIASWVEWSLRISDLDRGYDGQPAAAPDTAAVLEPILSWVAGLLDTPAMYLPQLVDVIQPDTVVLLTLRDPKAWYKSRTAQKTAAEKLCRKDLWDSVAHPFSVGECVAVHGSGGLVKLGDLGEEDGAEAFIRYNSWVAAVVPRRQLVRFCLWDCNADGACSHEQKLHRLYAILLQRGLLLHSPFASGDSGEEAGQAKAGRGLMHAPHAWDAVAGQIRRLSRSHHAKASPGFRNPWARPNPHPRGGKHDA